MVDCSTEVAMRRAAVVSEDHRAMIRKGQTLDPRLLLVLAACLLLTGNGCEGDKTVEPPPVPTITIIAPATGDTCSGDVQLNAEGENADFVTFYADTIAVGTDDIAPYETTWNSMTVPNGPHTLWAKAEGVGGVNIDSIDVNVYNLVIVTITPDSAYVFRGHQKQFYATVEGALDTTVTWHVDEGKTLGTITADGLFTAVEELMASLTAKVRARSAADPAKSATAIVRLLPDLRVEAETCFSPGGTYGNIEGRRINQAPCSHASGGLGVDGIDADGEWIKLPFELPADMAFRACLTSASATGQTRTYEILFRSSPPGTSAWMDTLHTPPGLGCC